MRSRSIAILGLLLLTGHTFAATMTAHFIDVGQGAATLLEFPCGAVLIDAGGEKSSAQNFDSSRRLKAYLDTFFTRRDDLESTLDAVFISHPHTDHTRGIAELMKAANGYDVLNVVDNAQNTGSGISQQQKLRAWAKANANYKGVRTRDIVGNAGFTNATIDPLESCEGVDPKIRVLWGSVKKKPAAWSQQEYDDENNHSVVIRVDFGKASFLFPGDLEAPAEKNLMKKYAGTNLLDVDVYQVSHHGSHTGNAIEFLSAMSPRIVVIPDGAHTREHGSSAWAYGHPREECVDRLLGHIADQRVAIQGAIAIGVKNFKTINVSKALYSTGWDGTILITATDAAQYVVTNTGIQ
jgi:competence protein ComEC